MTALTPGFMLLQGNQLELLRDLLVRWVSEQPLAPLEPECLLVQSNGMAQWLKLALAEDPGCGIAAALDMQLPGRFVWQAYRSVFEDLPSQSPFDKAPLGWRLYGLLGDLPGLAARLPQGQCLEPLQGFLQQDDDPRRRYQLAMGLADLFDQYQLYRADWLHDWAEGRDRLRLAKGQLQPLAAKQLWQPALWRLLREGLAAERQDRQAPWSSASRAEIHQAFVRHCATLGMEDRPAQLPRRLILFGISSLPRQVLELLQAIAPFTQVMVFSSNPCREYWGDLIEGKELLRREYRRIRQRKLPRDAERETLHQHGNPLLAAWGKQGRDYLHLLDELDQPERYRDQFTEGRIDLWQDPGEDCLLHQLQGDILRLDSLPERHQLASLIDPARDRSLEFIIAHSPQREVEILHDQLLDAFEQACRQGRSLALRDVLVMAPDIDTYAPHIQAVFGRHAARPGASGTAREPRFLPFHISDRGQRRHNSLIIALERLLQLPESRFAVSELLDLLDTPALRRRYGLNPADLPRLGQWIRGANIRWGLDGAQRASLDLPDLEQNSWMFGLRRMLLGYAQGDAGAWQGIEPYAEIGGLEAALVGPLYRLLQDLAASREQLRQAQTPEAWLNLLQDLLQRFFLSDSTEDDWALNQLELQLERLLEFWLEAGLATQTLPLEVVREALLAALDRPSLSQKFLAGAINFATLMPMRAVPFKQIWLLGMNDGDYPRSHRTADFDLMARDYRPGDRSRREDDRYLFLEALLSARERLVISWVGRDIRDGSLRPPSVLLGQLRDHIAAGWRLAQDQSEPCSEAARRKQLLAALTTEHPLQPFSRRYFSLAPEGKDTRLFTYAHEWRRVHTGPERPEQGQSVNALASYRPEGALGLGDLAEFLRRPLPCFYQRRLGVADFRIDAAQEDSETFAVQGLEKWSLQDQMLRQVGLELAQAAGQVANKAPAELLACAAQGLRRAGQLPMPPFASALQRQLGEELQPPLERYLGLLTEYTQALPAQLGELGQAPAKVQLQARLADLRANAQGEVIRLVLQASRLYQGDEIKWYQLVRHWPAHLFAQLRQPVTTRLLGPESDIILPPLAAEQAETWLLDLLQAWHEAMQHPLPLPCKTAFGWLLQGRPQQTYEGGFRQEGEIQEHPGYQRLWPDYASLAAEPAFMAYSQRLYGPVVNSVKPDL
ncbi:exodeoxyribonuclease V subunit gamma [Magnetovirga frankeli]|uniref:exodeoxyribonuclease V subunit gamma n=1 Tax=Magnetovirga frankeli TaxID=947516 RepID=UPI0012935634|nr:exodeoxyribonuclease V subunit gamma [gamma proteobacterium SS-5]